MPIFYLSHHLMHYTFDLKSKSDGQKNCMTFLFGVILWVLIWVGIYSLKKHVLYDAIRTGFIVILLADISVMAYIYKSYYGRLIFNEIDETDENTDWKFNKKTKKYNKKTDLDIYKEEREKIEEFDNYLSKINKEKKKINIHKVTSEIIKNKNRTHASIYIQKWWRRKLYHLKQMRSVNNR